MVSGGVKQVKVFCPSTNIPSSAQFSGRNCMPGMSPRSQQQKCYNYQIITEPRKEQVIDIRAFLSLGASDNKPSHLDNLSKKGLFLS